MRRAGARGRRPNESLSAYAAAILEQSDLIVAANRAPYELTATGALRRGSGGVVTALLAVAEATGATWVASARNETERRAAARGDDIAIERDGRMPFRLRFAPTDALMYDKHYGVIANPLLWFIQHYLWQLAYEPVIDETVHDAWCTGYAAVNQLIAQAIVDGASTSHRQPVVLFQDYHLYLAPRHVRDLLPHAALQHFIHIPWPTPQYWTVLPRQFREAILDGLLANDVVGFQTERDVQNFLASCKELMGLRVDYREKAVLHRGRVSWVRAYPVSVDVEMLRGLASSDEVQVEDGRVASWRAEKLIVRIDRTDPIKNVVRGFLAYERLLSTRPELVGKVQFWAFLQPSRQDVAAYTEYLGRIRSTASRINREHGAPGWEPIRLDFGENLAKAVAAYKAFDVLLVNSISDGMNLVAKEGMLLNQADGVLVLSENAGAHEQLGAHAISINPFDVEAAAHALHQALTMPVDERRTRGEGIRAEIKRRDIASWLKDQLTDIRDLAPRANADSRNGMASIRP